MSNGETIISAIEKAKKQSKENAQDVIIVPFKEADMIIALLKVQEAVEPHYTTLRYLVNGMEVAIQHPECPRCIENGLMLWDAEIEKGQAYCKRCGHKVKWNG